MQGNEHNSNAESKTEAHSHIKNTVQYRGNVLRTFKHNIGWQNFNLHELFLLIVIISGINKHMHI